MVRFPKMADELENHAKEVGSFWFGVSGTDQSDQILVRESYRLPVGTKGKPGYRAGRKVVSTDKLVLLDEPYAALDATSRAIVERFLAERPAGLTVVMATHDPADARRSDRVLELRGGALRLLHDCAGHDHRHA